MQTLKEYKKKVESHVCTDCDYYADINFCLIGTTEFFRGKRYSSTCTKNPQCMHRQCLIEKHRYLVQSELVSDLIEKNRKQKEKYKRCLMEYRKKKRLTFIEEEFGRILTKLRTLLKNMEEIQYKYDKGTKEFIICRTVRDIIKLALGPYARIQMKTQENNNE